MALKIKKYEEKDLIVIVKSIFLVKTAIFIELY